MPDDRNPLAGINLNLFPVLDALLKHRSGAQAAAALGVTPSAISHSLRELRAIFDDPLFLRMKGGLVPTARALDLEPAIRASLGALGGTLQGHSTFEPAQSGKRCTLAMGDSLGPTVVPAFTRRVMRQAPGMVLDFRMQESPAEALLANNTADLVVHLSQDRPSWVGRAVLYTDHMMCLVRSDHPTLHGHLTLDDYLSHVHVRVSPDGFGPSAVDHYLAEQGLRRRISAFTGSFTMAPEIVAVTDAILTLPSRLAQAMASRLDLQQLPPPLEFPSFTIEVIWHRGYTDDALEWIRAQLHQAADEVFGEGRVTTQ
ncbi:MAG: LysR family transcriptional regulator [Bradymonadia bacterium]